MFFSKSWACTRCSSSASWEPRACHYCSVEQETSSMKSR